MKVTMRLKTTKVNSLLWKRDKALENRSVVAGVSGKHAFLARIHEFGCQVPVTEKMRKFMHTKGVHFKKNTHFLNIPERAFLRSGYDSIRSQLGSRAADIWCSTNAVESDLSSLGKFLSQGIQNYVQAGIDPPKQDFPLSEGTIPLIGSGEMVNGIRYEVR